MSTQVVYPVNIHPESPRMVRSFVVAGERPFLVDTGIPGSALAILAELERLGIAPGDIALIVITHAHPDHAGSLAEMVSLTGAPVLAQSLDAAKIAVGASEPVISRLPEYDEFAKRFGPPPGAPAGPAYTPVTVDTVVGEEASLGEFGIDARVFHTPGHTDGGLSVVLSNGEIIVGDIVGSTDGKPSLAGFATNESAMADSIRRVMALDPSVVHTCHDGSFERAQLVEAFG